ncbi:MAG: DUF4339 domain-containing protein [Akkermansiaceae bacterium]|nr:DUF4339 domain-containing protein [Akkermansiaceae bacterium]
MNDKFYILSEGKAQGPFSERGLEMLCSQKRITGASLICQEGDQNWITYSEFLKNRPVMIEETSVPVSLEPQRDNHLISQEQSQQTTDIKEVKIPFTSLVVEAFSIFGRLIIILSIVLAAAFFLFGIMSKNAVTFPIAILGAIGIFFGSLIYGGAFIAIANVVQCQLTSITLLKKIVEQTRK